MNYHIVGGISLIILCAIALLWLGSMGFPEIEYGYVTGNPYILVLITFVVGAVSLIWGLMLDKASKS